MLERQVRRAPEPQHFRRGAVQDRDRVQAPHGHEEVAAAKERRKAGEPPVVHLDVIGVQHVHQFGPRVEDEPRGPRQEERVRRGLDGVEERDRPETLAGRREHLHVIEERRALVADRRDRPLLVNERVDGAVVRDERVVVREGDMLPEKLRILVELHDAETVDEGQHVPVRK